MTVAHRGSMTQAEFRNRAEAQAGRYEFDGVQPLAMTGGSDNHARIVGNIAFSPMPGRARASRRITAQGGDLTLAHEHSHS